ncbi:mechanosensitive ion channel family protein [Hydrogenobacter sp. T-2]|uniref:mechanosensitive ion channel family protein n=1 Tax=Pampinifervens diazotrophicum TaxID=1632018 RepID=UPI002B2631B0|nr:mechanosensitive ion channel family protein [Hydrogenobacter sp. T-2]WPM31711.1 mechanosensitive ion channel family protein [Hydrogenobacter sp. T-2]
MSLLKTYGALLLILILVPSLGLFVERFVFYRLRRLSEKSPWGWDKVLIDSLRYIPTLWSFLIALYLVSEELKLPKSIVLVKDKALWVLFIISFALFLSRLVGGFLRLYINRYREDLPATSLVVQVSRVVILVVGVLIALDKIGIAITPILTALGVGGLAVALALKDTLENLFAGFHVLATKQIKVGDYVRLESGEEGFVQDITWRNTILRQPANNLIIVPNSKLSTSIIINFHMPQPEMSILVPVGVSYDSDLEKVERITLEVAREVQKEVEGGVPDFEPMIRLTAFGDFSINFNVILRAKDFGGQHLLRHEFIKRLKKRYEQEGIKIPFPVREVYLNPAPKN